MPSIQQLEAIIHSHLKGVRIFPITGPVKAGVSQSILVSLEPQVRIPLHTHDVDATMIIVAGAGQVVSADRDLDGCRVLPGMIVFFERNVPHGFVAEKEGLSFISQNGGIVDGVEDRWDIQFGPTE